MKKGNKVIIVIVCLVIIIGGGVIYGTHKSKESKLTLSNSQIEANTKVINELMSSINKNDYKKYETLVDSQLKDRDAFNELTTDINGNLGNYKSGNYAEGIKEDGQKVLVYDASFSKNQSVKLTVALNNENKVSGIHEV